MPGRNQSEVRISGLWRVACARSQDAGGERGIPGSVVSEYIEEGFFSVKARSKLWAR